MSHLPSLVSVYLALFSFSCFCTMAMFTWWVHAEMWHQLSWLSFKYILWCIIFNRTLWTINDLLWNIFTSHPADCITPRPNIGICKHPNHFTWFYRDVFIRWKSITDWTMIRSSGGQSVCLILKVSPGRADWAHAKKIISCFWGMKQLSHTPLWTGSHSVAAAQPTSIF